MSTSLRELHIAGLKPKHLEIRESNYAQPKLNDSSRTHVKNCFAKNSRRFLD